MIQNTHATYYVSLGTFSAVNASAGTPRILLPPKPNALTTNGNYNLYAILDSAAGSITAEVLACVEFNVPD